MTFQTITRTAFLLGATTALSGCFFAPGKFDSTLTVLDDGRFTFAYEGELVVGGIDELSDMAASAEANKPCWDTETGKERACTKGELAEQAAEAQQQQAMLQAMMGDASMTNVEEMAQFAEAMEGQLGWQSIEVAEPGVFNVEFSITSQLSHGFAFPVFDGMPTDTSFVRISIQDDDRVTIAAPGFSGLGGGGPMAGALGSMFGPMVAAAQSSGDMDTSNSNPLPDGTFRIVTNARILTNNTEDGSTESPDGMQTLSWTIEPGIPAAPEAKLALNPE